MYILLCKTLVVIEVSEEIIKYAHMFNKLMFENENEKNQQILLDGLNCPCWISQPGRS